MGLAEQQLPAGQCYQGGGLLACGRYRLVGVADHRPSVRTGSNDSCSTAWHLWGLRRALARTLAPIRTRHVGGPWHHIESEPRFGRGKLSRFGLNNGTHRRQRGLLFRDRGNQCCEAGARPKNRIPPHGVASRSETECKPTRTVRSFSLACISCFLVRIIGVTFLRCQQPGTVCGPRFLRTARRHRRRLLRVVTF